MSDAPTYEQLSALCVQLAAALEALRDAVKDHPAMQGREYIPLGIQVNNALTSYRTLSPDPVWQRVPEGCVVVPEEPTRDMAQAFMGRELSRYQLIEFGENYNDMIRARGEG